MYKNKMLSSKNKSLMDADTYIDPEAVQVPGSCLTTGSTLKIILEGADGHNQMF